MHFWKGIFWNAPWLHSCDLLDGRHTFEIGFLDDLLLEFVEKRNVIRSKIRWIAKLLLYSEVPLGHELLDAQHTQSRCFSDMPKSLVIIFQTISLFSCPINLRSFEQSTDDRHTSLAWYSQQWSQSCLMKASCTSSHLSTPFNFLWSSCITQKHKYVTYSYCSISACLWCSYLKSNLKFQVYSFLSDHS